MPSPFFSVIIATYNRAELITRALDSLLAQKETNFEVILIDDGSMDNTREAVESYLKKLNLTYFYQHNQGFIVAKNKGIHHATGKYLTFLDSDDEYASNHLKTRKEILEQHTGVDFLHGGVKVIGSEYVPDVCNPGQKIHLSKCSISGTFFVKRKAMLKIKGFEGTALTTDFDFMKRAIHLSLVVRKTNLPTYIYHREGSSITNDMLRKL